MTEVHQPAFKGQQETVGHVDNSVLYGTDLCMVEWPWALMLTGDTHTHTQSH